MFLSAIFIAAHTGPSDRKLRASEPLSHTSKRLLVTKDRRTIDGLIKSNASLLTCLERLEKIAQQPIAHTPCRYDTEEAENIVNQTHKTVDDQLTGVYVDLEERVLDNTEQVIANMTVEAQEELETTIKSEILGHLARAISSLEDS